MGEKTPKDFKKLFASAEWQALFGSMPIERQYELVVEKYKFLIGSEPNWTSADEGDTLWEVRRALSLISGVLYRIWNTIKEEDCCKLPLDMADATNNEQIRGLKAGKCNGLLDDGEDFSSLDVCKTLKKLNVWILNCHEALKNPEE